MRKENEAAASRTGVHLAASRVTEILIAPSPASPMISTTKVRAVPGKGLYGDRYFFGVGTFSPQPQKADFEITLIEEENVQAFAAASGLPFTASHARRNIVTKGARLNELVGKEFYVGEVCVRGIRLCEPCSHLAKNSFAEALKGLVHQGGLRAQIISGGAICVGDKIRVAQ